MDSCFNNFPKHNVQFQLLCGISWRTTNFIAAPHLFTICAIPRSKRNQTNPTFRGFTKTLAFLLATASAFNINCLSSCGVVNRVYLHFPCSRLDLLQIFQAKNLRSNSLYPNLQCSGVHPTDILLIITLWLFKRNHTRFLSCLGCGLCAGEFEKGTNISVAKFFQSQAL